MRYRLLALGLAALMTYAGQAPAAEWTVAYQGAQDHRTQHFNVDFAAKELSRYMSKVLGERVDREPWEEAKAQDSKVIYLTDVRHAPDEIAEQLKGTRRDAFVIKYPYDVEGKEVCLIATRDQFAYDFAAYYFLTEFLDVHWVGPGELGEVIRVQSDWRMPESVDVLFNPDFGHRFWYDMSFTGRKWLGASQRMGFHHALGRVFKPEKYADEFPQVYPLINGERYIPNNPHGWQPCTTDPKSIEIATEYVLERLEQMPERSTISLSVNDGAGNVCECDECVALDGAETERVGGRRNLSDRFFTFYNEVAERVTKVKPEAQIGVMSYGAVKQPPQHMRIHPAVQVFHVSPRPARIAAWAQAGASANLYQWLWDGGWLVIRPDMRRIAEQLRMAEATGGRGFYTETLSHWPSAGPRMYVLAHLLRDADREVASLYREYLTLAYGSYAAPHVHDYFRRWDTISNRHTLEEQYVATRDWRRYSQFEHLRREDLDAMNAALKRAAHSEMTDRQRRRFEYLHTYARWLNLNADQVLLGREMSDPAFVGDRSFDELASIIEPSLDLSAEFKRIWDEQIYADETGWLIDEKFRRRDPWDLFYGQLRMLVSSKHDRAVAEAMRIVTEQHLAKHDPDATLAWLDARMQAHPKMAAYIGPQINRLKGIEPENVVPNGDFEQGAMAQSAPDMPGWLTYADYGQMKNASNEYRWAPDAGHDGNGAVGIGPGDYGELRTGFTLEEGARYRLTFWTKTENRAHRNAQLWIFRISASLDELANLDNKKHIRRFLRFEFPTTDDQWTKHTYTFTASAGGNFIMQPTASRQPEGQWLWLDDIELVKLWP